MKKLIEKIVIFVTCIALFVGNSSVRILAEEIQDVAGEGSSYIENTQIDTDTIETESIIMNDATGNNDDCLSNESGEIISDDISVERIQEEQSNVENGLTTYEPELEVDEMEDSIESVISDLQSVDMLYSDDFEDKYGLTYKDLIFRCPEYLQNEQMEYYISKRFNYAADVWDETTRGKEKTARVVYDLKKGLFYSIDDLVGFGVLSDADHKKFQKEIAKRAVCDYLRSEDASSTVIREMSQNFSTFNKAYSITENAAEFAEDLARVSNHMKYSQILSILNTLKDFEPIQDHLKNANEISGIVVSIISLEELNQDAVSVLIESQEINRTNNDLYEGLLLLKEELSNPVAHALGNYATDKVVDLVLKSMDGGAFALLFGPGGYALEKILSTGTGIICSIYEWKNVSYSDIKYSTIAFMYYINSENALKAWQKKLTRTGSNNLRNMILYEAAYEIRLSCLRVFMKTILNCTSDGNQKNTLKSYYDNISNDIYPDGLYALYINLCMTKASEALKNGTLVLNDTEVIRKTNDGRIIDESYDSSESIANRFSIIQNQFKPNIGQTWTGSWGGCIQCFGFARMVFSQLFGCEMPSAYSGSKPYSYPNESNVIKIGQLEGANVDSQSVKQLLSQGKLGDIIQASGSTYGQHTMVFVGVGADYVRVYDCNAAVNGGTAGSCTINEWDIPFSSVAQWYGTGSNCGLTLYRAANYGEIYGDGDYYFYDDSVNFVIENGVLVKYNGWQRNVVIPDGVTSIGQSAFANNTSMFSVYIPDGVLSIEIDAFSYCSNLQGVFLPDSIERIEYQAFLHCNSMRSLKLPANDKYTTIRFNTFKDSGIVHLVIPDNVNTIEGSAFCGCKGLIDISWPKTKLQIFRWAFRDCNALESVTITPNLDTEAFNPRQENGQIFSGCVNLKNVTIEDGVEIIGTNLFRGCKGITKIKFPDSVKIICRGAFYDSNIKDLRLPKYIESLGEDAFSSCIELQKVFIPKTLKSGSSSSRGSGPFRGCNSLKEFEFEEGIEIIAEGLFAGTKIEKIVIPNTVKVIDEFAFSGCTELREVLLPNSLQWLGMSCFSSCTSLEKIYIPDGVKFDNGETFMWGIFYECTNLKEVRLPNDITALDYVFEKCVKLESIDIPDCVETMEGTFRNCTSLKKIILPSALKKISRTFEGCSMLEEVAIPTGVQTLGEYAFRFCDNLSRVCLSNNLECIERNVFEGCDSLETIVIPDSLRTIGNYAFSDCRNLKYIYIPKSVTSMNYSEIGLLYKYDKTYTYYPISDFMLYCDEGSTAESYAKKYGIPYTTKGLPTYQVRYELNDGKNNNSNPNTFTIIDVITLMDPSRVGYKFEGWYTESDFINRVTKLSSEIGSDVTLYAKWKYLYELDSYQAVLNDNFDLKFIMSLSEEVLDDSSSFMEFNIDGKKQNVKPSMMSDGCAAYYCKIPAKQINDVITARLFFDGKYYEVSEYSLKEYFDNFIVNDIQNPKYEILNDLSKSILNYGSYCQKYFGYKENNLANKDIYTDNNNPVNVISDEAIINSIANEERITKNNSEFIFAGASLTCLSNTYLNAYFFSANALTLKDIKDNYEVYVNGVSSSKVSYSIENGMLKVTVKDIPAAELDDTYEFVIKSSSGSMTLEYCPLIYIKKALNSSSDRSLKDLCKALYLYNQESNKYFD